MGTKTLGGFRDELAFLFDNRGDTGFNQARLTGWINFAYLHCTNPKVHRHREMQAVYTVTMATGVNEYSLSPSTVGYNIISIRNASHVLATAYTATARKRKLNPRSSKWFDERTLPSGQPTTYGIDGETLYISGVPTANENGQLIRLRVWREPGVLVAASQTTVLPNYWDRVIQLGAQWTGELDLGYRDRAELTKGDYMALINEPGERQELEAEDTGWEVELGGQETRMY